MRADHRRGAARSKLPVRPTFGRIAAAYRARWRLLVPAAIVIFVPLSGLEALEGEAGTLEGAPDAVRLTGVLLLVLITAVVSTLGDQLYSGLVGEAAAELRTGRRRLSLAELFRSLPYPRLVAIDLIVTVAVAGGLVLLLLPGVLAFGWLSLAAPVSTMEDRGVRDSLRRSRELVRGSFWRVLAVLVPILVAAEVASEALQAGVGAVVGDDVSADWVGAAGASALAAPVLALAAVVIAAELIELRDPAVRAVAGANSTDRGVGT